MAGFALAAPVLWACGVAAVEIATARRREQSTPRRAVSAIDIYDLTQVLLYTFRIRLEYTKTF
jgi:hypothetical protein